MCSVQINSCFPGVFCSSILTILLLYDSNKDIPYFLLCVAVISLIRVLLTLSKDIP